VEILGVTCVTGSQTITRAEYFFILLDQLFQQQKKLFRVQKNVPQKIIQV
jgi:hypothetical protein